MDKIYTSTRDKTNAFTPKEAILKGIADDGGLFIYDHLNELKLPLKEMMEMDYMQMAETVLALLLPDFNDLEIKSCVHDAYADKFRNDEITPLQFIGDDAVLELFHGPTCAFKDIGLRMLPQLMKEALKTRPNESVMILTATSGDTGKAALEGFKDVDRTAITVFYPESGVSNIQKLQMVTTTGKNTCVCAIRGNFDDAQSNVKKLFNNVLLTQSLQDENITLSSANSINIGRLIPQIVYYIYAYKKMIDNQKIIFGEQVNFCVPTGNYGNVLAGYYAKCMGLPVHKFIVASNANNVLYDFLKDGIYDRKRPFYKTISPSMDILISSNLERLLYYKCGKDSDYVNELMNELMIHGSYQIHKHVLDSIREDFIGGYCSDEECAQVIQQVYMQHHYVMDPHTAVAYKVMKNYEKQSTDHPTILLSTASPYKFAPEVLAAIQGKHELDEYTCMKTLEEITDECIPEPLKQLNSMDVRHSALIDKDDMESFVEKTVGALLYD